MIGVSQILYKPALGWRKRKINMTEAWKTWMATKKSVFDSEKSAWGRSASVEIGTAKCEICEEVTTIMSIDSSSGEYGSFDCCKTCFEKLWEKAND